MNRLAIIFNAFTQLLASILCVNLNANESLSGAMYRRRHERTRYMVTYRVINAVFFWEKDHCAETAFNEVADCHALIDAYRNK